MIEQTRVLGRIYDKGKVHAVYTEFNIDEHGNNTFGALCNGQRINKTVSLTDRDESVLCGTCFMYRDVPWRSE